MSTSTNARRPVGAAFRHQVIDIFRYDDQGRLAEEWVQSDTLGLLRQLGVKVP